jgi:hypothetical protein
MRKCTLCAGSETPNERTKRSPGRPLNPLPALAGIALLAVASVYYTDFASVQDTLGRKSWGADTPTSSSATAFATFQPWWNRYKPNAVVVRPDGGIEPVVEIPRSAIHQKEGKLSLPNRSIGYEAFLGAVTFWRSVFRDTLVFDFALIVRIQQMLLVISLVAASCTLLFAKLEPLNRGGILCVSGVVYGIVLHFSPNQRTFLVEGIIDSALLNQCALLSVLAFALIVRFLPRASWRAVLGILAAGLLLGFSLLVRGELLFVFLFVFGCMAVAVASHGRRYLTTLALSLAVCLSVPTTYGLVNTAIFGHFVPLRMQSGQNLVEPIGQFPNPYGIEYDDEWVMEYLAERDIDYVSFEADALLTRWYFDILRENPGLLFRNFYLRMRSIPEGLGYGLNVWTIPLFVSGGLWLSRRDIRHLHVFVPLFLAVGFLLFYGWFNSMVRVVMPAHYLYKIFVTFAVVALTSEVLSHYRAAEPWGAVVSWKP